MIYRNLDSNHDGHRVAVLGQTTGDPAKPDRSDFLRVACRTCRSNTTLDVRRGFLFEETAPTPEHAEVAQAVRSLMDDVDPDGTVHAALLASGAVYEPPRCTIVCALPDHHPGPCLTAEVLAARARKPSYRDAVDWIAENDELPTGMDGLSVDDVAEMISVEMTADLFGKSAAAVAADVVARRLR